MANHWDSACALVETLAYLVKRMDDDGLDIVRANAPQQIFNSSKSSKLRDFARKCKPNPSDRSNLVECLRIILGKYTLQPKRSRRWTIYVFTDANWEGNDHACKVDQPVREFFETNGTGNQIGIQFILFGDAPGARQRMEHLDNLPGVPRLVLHPVPTQSELSLTL
jgi:hypothetical protein